MDGSFFENQASRRIISMVIRSDNIIRDSLGIFSRTNSIVLVSGRHSSTWTNWLATSGNHLFVVLISTIISTFDKKRGGISIIKR
jgi:hypothetical protein